MWLVSSERELSRGCAETALFLSKGTAAGLTQNCGKLCACSSSASLLRCQSQLPWQCLGQKEPSSAWTTKENGDPTTGSSFSPKQKLACHARKSFGSCHLPPQILVSVANHSCHRELRLPTPLEGSTPRAIVRDLSSDPLL